MIIILIISLALLSCQNKSQNNKTKPLINKIYQKKLNEVKKNPQFIIDKLDLLYHKKGLHNNEAMELIKKLPQKYKYIIATYKIMFLIENPKNIPLNRKFLSILLKYQDCLNIRKYIAENFYKANSETATKAFYFLYATNYNFTSKDIENYHKIKPLKKFTELNFNIEKPDFCKEKNCINDIKSPEEYLNYIKNEIYYSKHENTKELYKDYKNILKINKKLKKEIKKLSFKNKKNKGKHKEELKDKINKLKIYNNKILPYLKLYFYFFSNGKKYPKTINRYEVAENFLKANTPPNKKIFYFVYSLFKKKPYPIKINYYKYLKNSDLKLSKKDINKLNFLKYTKKYFWLKYGYYKKNFPDLFKKLNVKNYLGKYFIFTVVKDFEWFFIENFRKKPRKLSNLLYFRYSPSYIAGQKNKLFKLYTTDKLGHHRISGNEALLYGFLKILLKANENLNKNQVEFLKPLRIIYIQEILKLFK